ncbi:MAG TPA: hypothetical protein VH643_13950 [Gemmataceae bacterium]|jgi:hypothetical protein
MSAVYEAFVWVPTKGWKLLKRTKLRSKALEAAWEFEPLEVRVTMNGVEIWKGGDDGMGKDAVEAKE